MERSVSGAIAENTAANYFLANGYEVWWPAVQQSRADFVVSKDRKYLKVQVKKATWSFSKPNEYLQVRVERGNKRYEPGDFDLFVVVDEQRVWVIPDNDLAGKTSLSLDSRGPTAGCRTQFRTRTYDPTLWLVN